MIAGGDSSSHQEKCRISKKKKKERNMRPWSRFSNRKERMSTNAYIEIKKGKVTNILP